MCGQDTFGSYDVHYCLELQEMVNGIIAHSAKCGMQHTQDVILEAARRLSEAARLPRTD